MIGLVGLLGMLLIGLSMDAASNDDDAAGEEIKDAKNASEDTVGEDAGASADRQGTGEPTGVGEADDGSGGSGTGVFEVVADIDPMTGSAAPAASISGFDGTDDKLVILYDDPSDSDPELELVQTSPDTVDVFAFGVLVAQVTGTPEEVLDLQVEDIALVNTALG